MNLDKGFDKHFSIDKFRNIKFSSTFVCIAHISCLIFLIICISSSYDLLEVNLILIIFD